MIQLSEDCLLFRNEAGEQIPYSAEVISVEVSGDGAGLFDPEFIKQAAAAVFHYFRDELGRESVSMSEFSRALERVLRGFSINAETAAAAPAVRVAQADLRPLADAADMGGELFFFPRLRDELRAQLRTGPQVLCFLGLRPCVKRLAGAQRWSPRCAQLQDQIIEFLRNCMTQEATEGKCALMVK